jgi:arabinoxylan arabinofuranohydrolase
LLGTLDVKNKGDSHTWKVQVCKIKEEKGVHDLYFVFKGGEGELFNFDWWKFKK